MGFCDIQEASYDRLTTYHNQNRVLCEISPNILYQYVLMVLWFFFVASISVSICGLVSYIGGHLYRVIFFSKASPKGTLYKFLSLREIEYLQFIKKKNMVVYGDVLRKLKQHRFNTHDAGGGGVVDSDYEASNKLVYSSFLRVWFRCRLQYSRGAWDPYGSRKRRHLKRW